ncbi:hypothetical protein FRB93_013678 [Tulasnella sp. JGI-2019a]|nr:hypothetical protein FRB93_013678 [Tulasnella sp. JGI-2019a]
MSEHTHFHSDHHQQLPYHHPHNQYPHSPPPLESAPYDNRSYVIPPPQSQYSPVVNRTDIHISTKAALDRSEPIVPTVSYSGWDETSTIYQQRAAFDQETMYRYGTTASTSSYTTTEGGIVQATHQQQQQQQQQPHQQTPYESVEQNDSYMSTQSYGQQSVSNDPTSIYVHADEGVVGYDPDVRAVPDTYHQQQSAPILDATPSLDMQYHAPAIEAPQPQYPGSMIIMSQDPTYVGGDSRIQQQYGMEARVYHYPSEGSYAASASTSMQGYQFPPQEGSAYHTTGAAEQYNAIGSSFTSHSHHASNGSHNATYDEHRYQSTTSSDKLTSPSSSKAPQPSPISPMPSALDVYVHPTGRVIEQQPQSSTTAPLAPLPQFSLPATQPEVVSRSSSLAGWADLSPQSNVIAPTPLPIHFPSPCWPTSSHGSQQPHVVKDEHPTQTREYQVTDLNSPVEPCYPQYQTQQDAPQQQHRYQQQSSSSRPSTQHGLTIDTHVSPAWSSSEPSAVSQQSDAATHSGHHRMASYTSLPTPTSGMVRQAAGLSLNTSTASGSAIRGPDITHFPTHEARLLQRQQERRRAALEPYPTEKEARQRDRASSSSRRNSHQHQSSISPTRRIQPPLPPPPPAVTSSAPPRYQASGNGNGASVEGPIRFSDPPVMDTPCSGKGKAADKSQQGSGAVTDKVKAKTEADDALQALLDKKPFLACEFCRHRKIACGQRDPHARDGELGDGPRTCNQCARRGLLCCYPGESRRGMRHGRASRRVSYKDGSNIVFTPGSEDECSSEEEEEEEEPQPGPSNGRKKQPKKKKKSKKKKPMEWIIAVDAHFITPGAWQAYLHALAIKKAEKEKAAADSAAAIAAGVVMGVDGGAVPILSRVRGRDAPPGSEAWPGPHDDRYSRQHNRIHHPPHSSSAAGPSSYQVGSAGSRR